MNNKKSQGELITTVLMILVILAAIAGIAYFVNNMIQSKINSAQQHSECLEALIEIEPVIAGSNSLVLRNIGTRVINSISISRSGNLVSAFPISNELVSYWPLDSNTEDYFGQNDGVNSGAIQTVGKIGGAYSFDGVDDYININNPTTLNRDFTSLTLSGWFYSNVAQGFDAGLFGKGTGIYGCTLGPNLYCYILDGSNYVSTTYDSGWHYVTFSFNGTTMALYLDGVLKQNKISIYPSTGLGYEFTLGKAISYFKGSLDEVMIFNRSLSAEEINQLYTSGIKLNFSAGTSLPVSISPLVSGDRIEVSASIISSKGNEVNCGLRASTIVA